MIDDGGKYLLQSKKKGISDWSPDFGQRRPRSEAMNLREKNTSGIKFVVRAKSLGVYFASGEELIAERLYYAAVTLKACIDIDVNIRGGVPVLKDTGFKISQIFAEIAEGQSLWEISEDFDLDGKVLEEVVHAFAIYLDRPFGG